MGRLMAPLLIALRAWVAPLGETKQTGARRTPPSPRWPVDILVLDVETTTDPSQRLLFAWYRHCQWRDDGTLCCRQEGILYADGLPEEHPDVYAALESFAASHEAEVEGSDRTIPLLSRTEFLGSEVAPGPFWNLAYRAQALVVGFNLAFDLSRLAIGWGRAIRASRRVRDIFAGGFSLALWGSTNAQTEDRQDSRFHPRLRLKHIDSKRTLMKFSGRFLGKKKGKRRRLPGGTGRILDLKTFAFALTDEAHSLASACEAFKTRERKAKAEHHGHVDADYIEYARQDVRAEVSLLEATRREFDRHPIDLAPDQVRSPASIGKATLRAMGVQSPAMQFKDMPPELLGQAMTAYHGGRAEARIRHAIIPVIHTDFLAMYPTVNALLGLSELLTAERLEVVDATAEVRALLEQVELDGYFDPTVWRELRGFAWIQPADDIVPVRAQYAPASSGPGLAQGTEEECDQSPITIGVNPLTARGPLVLPLPDVVAAGLLRRSAPEVLAAWRVIPKGRQGALAPVKFRGQVEINPAEEDPFRRWIELRQLVKQGAHPFDTMSETERDWLQKGLKVLANSASYGIYAELNRIELNAGEREQVRIYGRGAPFVRWTSAPEEPGEYCFPIFAALTTSAARLMLALLERCVQDLGGHYAFCDTDSMAIVATERGGPIPCPNGPLRTEAGEPAVMALSRRQVEAIAIRFTALRPYDPAAVPDSILKIEDVNFVDWEGHEEFRQLYALAISAKRYALFNLDPDGVPVLRKPSEHGLGHLLDPTRGAGEPDIEQGPRRKEKWPRWIGAIWRLLISRARGQHSQFPAWFARPAVSRITVSTPRLLESFGVWNADRSYADGVKPMSFALMVHVDRLRLDVAEDRLRYQLIAPYETNADAWPSMTCIVKHTGAKVPITTDPDGPPGAVVVRTIGQVVEAYWAHAEPKSCDSTGNPCGPGTVGVLQRRPVPAERAVYIGKESNKQEEVEVGLITDINDVLAIYEDPAESRWAQLAVPLLQLIPVARIAKIARVSPRMAKYYRSGQKEPGPEARQRLLALLGATARALCRRKSSAPDARVVAERFLASGLARDPRQGPAPPSASLHAETQPRLHPGAPRAIMTRG